MARFHHQSLVPISLLLLLVAFVLTATSSSAAAAAAAAEEHAISITVQYAQEEEARWLDRWTEKYQAQGSDDSGSSVHPATEEESAYLNNIFDNGKKRRASGGHSHGGDQGGGGARAGGFDGHIEFDEDHPSGRIVVDKYHSPARSSSEPNGDVLKNHESRSHAEYDDVKDL